ncbi:MAG: energy transducer TonB [Acidobacteria bacterium]|nr:energy transducer TonB [Acidobacteriota bacterium]
MNSSRQLSPNSLSVGIILFLSLGAAAPLFAQAQTQQPTPEAHVSTEAVVEPTPAPDPAAAEAEATQKRLNRARSLAAIGKLAAAANELESVRSASRDESVKDVARLLLMAIFVEMPDYQRAGALLEEAFNERPANRAGDSATQFYFALAGQTVNAVRTHLERYRSFGVNVADASELPPDAASDVENLRVLLERVAEQARSLHAEQLKGGTDGTRGLDAAALLEDAATVRMRIARHDEDRAHWQSEVSEARQHLFASETRVASISPIPAARPTPPPATTAPAPKAAAPAATPNAGSKKAAQPSGGQRTNAAPSNAKAADAQPPAQQPAAAAPAGSGNSSPVAVGSLVGKAKSRVPPSYPPIARSARVSGNVTVFLVVNEKGVVESVIRAEGPQQLQQAAIEAARRWKFNPTVLDGQPVRVTGYLSFNFTL